MKMKVPGMGGPGMNASALQAALARHMEQAQAAERADSERTQAATINPQAQAQPQPQPAAGPGPSSQPVRAGVPPGHPQHRQQPQLPKWFTDKEQRHKTISIYPIYINAEKTVAGGRRVPKEIAVFRPVLKEMFLVLNSAGFDCIGVPKCHPRDTFKAHPSNVGRLYILFKDEEGNPLKPEIAKNKVEVLRYLCKMIPQLKVRNQPSYHQEMQAPPVAADNSAKPSTPTTSQKAPVKKRKPRKKR